jgi:hypothetical protein
MKQRHHKNNTSDNCAPRQAMVRAATGYRNAQGDSQMTARCAEVGGAPRRRKFEFRPVTDTCASRMALWRATQQTGFACFSWENAIFHTFSQNSPNSLLLHLSHEPNHTKPPLTHRKLPKLTNPLSKTPFHNISSSPNSKNHQKLQKIPKTPISKT